MVRVPPCTARKGGRPTPGADAASHRSAYGVERVRLTQRADGRELKRIPLSFPCNKKHARDCISCSRQQFASCQQPSYRNVGRTIEVPRPFYSFQQVSVSFLVVGHFARIILIPGKHIFLLLLISYWYFLGMTGPLHRRPALAVHTQRALGTCLGEAPAGLPRWR